MIRMVSRSRFTRTLALGLLIGSAGGSALAQTCPEIQPSDFTQEFFDTAIEQPMEMAIAGDGRIIYIERTGKVKLYRPDTKALLTAGTVATRAFGEMGLMGLALDPKFTDNGWLYIYFLPPNPPGPYLETRLSRFTMTGNVLDPASEKPMLRMAIDELFHHQGGGLVFDRKGNLLLGTGDNTQGVAELMEGYAPLDERPGHFMNDAQRTAANSKRLNGKILRIKPLADGTYAIPEGNLFAKDGSQGRPEIYLMGCRNAFRLSIDPVTDWLYFSDVGPDALTDSPERGPASAEEVNQARQAGNFGWPYFVADNQAYRDFNFATKVSANYFNPEKPVNESPNNTGNKELPVAQKAFIWWKTNTPGHQPTVNGNGSRVAIAGPVYRYDAKGALGRLPPQLDNTLFYGDWGRGFIKSVKMDGDGRIVSTKPFLKQEYRDPIDMEIGPDGAFYLLEWAAPAGSPHGVNSGQGRLSRIKYTGAYLDACIPVSTALSKAALRKPAGGLHTGYIGPSNCWIGLPDDRAGVEIFTTQGKRIARLFKKQGFQGIQVPEAFPSGTYLIRYISASAPFSGSRG